MRAADAGASLIAQQVIVTTISFAAVALTRSSSRLDHASPRVGLVATLAVLLLWAPMWLGSLAGPERWLTAGGVRLYIASMLVPAMVLALARALHASMPATRWALWLMPATLWALAAQPDASQATAFALACAAPLSSAGALRTLKALVAVTLAAGVAWAWWQPDPLVPVPYVEAVLELASAAGPVNLAAALAALAVPLVAILAQARQGRDPALVAVAIYYAAIGVLAWRQLTPMPLLGFGAGPIIGYALLAAAARRAP